MRTWTRCEYETDDYACQKFADVTVTGFGPVCLDHQEQAKQEVTMRKAVKLESIERRQRERETICQNVSADWECPQCGAMNPEERGTGRNRMRLRFCLKCYKARV